MTRYCCQEVYDDRRDREYALRSVREQLIRKAGEIVLDSNTPVCLKAEITCDRGDWIMGEFGLIKLVRGHLEFRAVRTLDQTQIKLPPIVWEPVKKQPTLWERVKSCLPWIK